MLELNRNLSALIYIQKIKSKQEAEDFLKTINREIANWIKEVREINESLDDENKKAEETVVIEGWHGKSSFEMQDYQDRIIVIKYQKPERGKEPKKVKTYVFKSSLEKVKGCIKNSFSFNYGTEFDKDKNIFVKSTVIAEKFYNSTWDIIFTQRKRHNTFTIMLNVLDKQDFIKYIGGRIYLENGI
jgi:hypothetical protein